MASRTLYRYWEAARAEKAAPARSAIDLKPIAALVPNLAILEQPQPEGNFLWRLAGTGVCDLLGREATGSRVTLGFDAFESDIMHRLLIGVIRNLQPCVFKLSLTSDVGEKFAAELIGLPLLAHDGRSLQVLAGVFPLDDLSRRRSNKLANIRLLGARSIWTEHLPGDSVVENAHQPRFQIIRGGRV